MTTEGAAILGPKGQKFFEDRGIDLELVARLGIHTGHFKDGEVVASGAASANIIVYPVLNRAGERLYDKYRGLPKKFWREAGTEEIPAVFYGQEVLADPALYRDHDPVPLVITEGYEDRLVAMQARFPLSVSVPDGAPAVTPKKKEKDEDFSADAEDKKFAFLFNSIADLKRVKRIIIAVDADGPGKALAEELVRRLGAARCAFVVFPEGCKDLSDVLREHGIEVVYQILCAAQDYPVFGIFKLTDYPDRDRVRTYASGWNGFDSHFQIYPGAFVVMTGIPGHGKSTFNSQWLINLSELHGWKHAIITPEMPVVPMYRDKLRRQILRKAIYRNGNLAVTRDELDKADLFINNHFTFIESDPRADDDDELTVEWTLEKADEALLRYGIHTLTWDPWNEMEHAMERGETEERYTNRSLRKIRRWGTARGVAQWVLAHPTKSVADKGVARAPTPYDISGSAHWFNKPDAIVVVHTPDFDACASLVNIPKVRHAETGRKGNLRFSFDPASERYYLPDEGQQENMF